MKAAEDQRYVSSREAARLLGVKPATLYAYVSRGLLESMPGARGRARRYRRADLERLRAEGRRAGAGAALRWGEPVLDSAITAMTQEGPEYRGRSALALAAADVPFEAVAELLWTGVLPPGRPAWPAGAADLAELGALLPEGTPAAAIHALVVAALAPRDAGRFDLRSESVLERARRLIRTLAASFALARPGTSQRVLREALAATSVAGSVALALGSAPRPRVTAAIDRALVLLADHELNVSTFAARVAASAHADPYAAVLAGLAALSGPRHGAASDRAEALVAEIEARATRRGCSTSASVAAISFRASATRSIPRAIRARGCSSRRRAASAPARAPRPPLSRRSTRWPRRAGPRPTWTWRSSRFARPSASRAAPRRGSSPSGAARAGSRTSSSSTPRASCCGPRARYRRED